MKINDNNDNILKYVTRRVGSAQDVDIERRINKGYIPKLKARQLVSSRSLFQVHRFISAHARSRYPITDHCCHTFIFCRHNIHSKE